MFSLQKVCDQTTIQNTLTTLSKIPLKNPSILSGGVLLACALVDWKLSAVKLALLATTTFAFTSIIYAAKQIKQN